MKIKLDKYSLDLTPIAFPENFLKKVENKYNATYICETELNDTPVLLFYSEKEHPVSKSHYFVVFQDPSSGSIMISNGQKVAEQEIVGMILEESKEIIYSHYRHHLAESNICYSDDFIDGGRSYIRASVGSKFCKLKVERDSLTFIKCEEHNNETC